MPWPRLARATASPPRRQRTALAPKEEPVDPVDAGRHTTVCDVVDETIDEEPFRTIVERVEQYLPSLVLGTSGDDLAAMSAELKDRAKNNIALRRQIVDVVVALLGVGQGTSSPVEALDEWRAKRAVNREKESFLARAINLQVAISDLSAARFEFRRDAGPSTTM